MEDNKHIFKLSIDFSELDEKLQEFVMLRNKLAFLAKELELNVIPKIVELQFK